MRNVDRLWRCHFCEHHSTINYADGSSAIGCLAHNMENPYPADVRNLDKCPLDKHEKE